MPLAPATLTRFPATAVDANNAATAIAATVRRKLFMPYSLLLRDCSDSIRGRVRSDRSPVGRRNAPFPYLLKRNYQRRGRVCGIIVHRPCRRIIVKRRVPFPHPYGV